MARKSYDEVKHQAILKAATRLFLKQGFTKTTMDDVAALAKVTKQTVYAHYQSKDALFEQIIVSLCGKYSAASLKQTAADRSFADLLFDRGMLFLSLITSQESLAATQLVIAESQQHPKLAQLYYESGTQFILKEMTAFLQEQKNLGKTKVPSPVSAASYFMAMLKGQYYLRNLLRLPPEPTEEEMQAHVKEVVQIFLHLFDGASPLGTRSVL